MTQPSPVRVLILSGANVHDWAKTTPQLVKIYRAHPRFGGVKVLDDVTTLDAAMMDDCDVVVSNFTKHPQMSGRFWGKTAETAFVEGIRKGKGFVAFHAACSADQDWPEIQQLFGLTWKWNETNHTAYHPFRIEMMGTDHPITRGVPAFWIVDELYQKMWKQTPAEFQVLAHAFANSSWNGTAQYEPMLLVTGLGKGRGVNLLPGHDVAAMENVGFQTLLLRSTEWVATGQVTVPVPASMPTTPAAAIVTGVDPGAAVANAARYVFGQSRQPLAVVEQLVMAATSGGQPDSLALAQAMARLLSSDASPEAKNFFCKQLAIIGADEQVPALASLLTDEKTSDHARYALERIPRPKAGAALQTALGRTEARLKIGIINSIGNRRDVEARLDLLELSKVPDADIAGAATVALEKIGAAGHSSGSSSPGD